MQRRTLLALLLILGTFPLAAYARRRGVQLPPPVIVPEAIVTTARHAANAALAAGVPAVQIAVTHRGQLIYSEAFGVTDAGSASRATSRSVMQAGSITKQFTAAAILRLADRGALSLDDRIEKFVPEFNPRGETITLRHLLNHTSGVSAPAADPYSPATRAQWIASVNAQPFAFPPGSMWSYNGAGYKLLGYAIESISGMSYADFIRSELALPLGLLDTGVCGAANLPVPEGYTVPPEGGAPTRVPAIDMPAIFASGALCSTASDLARWSHLLADGRVVLPATYAAMIAPTILTNNAVVPYGLGVSVQKIYGQRAVSHAGTIPGFWSFLLYLSDQDIGVAVITNALGAPSEGNAELIAQDVARTALDTF